MALNFSLVDITLIAALIAIGVTFFAYVMLWRRLARERSIDKEIDAQALVQEFSQRSRRLEERLVEQKVRLEILELRQQRQNVAQSNRSVPLHAMAQNAVEATEKLSFERENEITQEKDLLSEEFVVKGNETQPHLIRSEAQALRFVLGSGVKGTTAKEIQIKIGRSREHTARMMNSLFKEGLVERNNEARPFTYRITEKGRRAAME